MINFEEVIKNIDPDMDYKLSEAAKIVGISYTAMLAHSRRGHFPVRKVFSRWYVHGRDLRNYLTGKN